MRKFRISVVLTCLLAAVLLLGFPESSKAPQLAKDTTPPPAVVKEKKLFLADPVVISFSNDSGAAARANDVGFVRSSAVEIDNKVLLANRFVFKPFPDVSLNIERSLETPRAVRSRKSNAETIVGSILDEYGAIAGTVTLTAIYGDTLAYSGRFALNTGEVFVIKAGDEFEQLAVNQMPASGEQFMATPAASDGQLFIRSDKHLYCIGRTD